MGVFRKILKVSGVSAAYWCVYFIFLVWFGSDEMGSGSVVYEK